MLDKELNNRLQNQLAKHTAFTSNRLLQAMFVDVRLSAWSKNVPEATTIAERVSLLVAYLAAQWSDREQNALYLFVRVLAEGAEAGTSEKDELAKLADQLEDWQARRATGRRGLLTPPAPPSPFVGRERLREQVAKALRQGKVQRLVGLGGIGKTDLAKIVVQDVAGHFDHVLWVSLETQPTSETVWVDICRALGETAGNRPREVARQALSRGRVLLVLDNAESAGEVVEDVLAERGRAVVLLTSRDRLVGALAGGLREVKPLGREESVALWRELVGGERLVEEKPSRSLRPGRLAADERLADDDINRLCELVGDLPQALRLAGGYVTAYSVGVGEYVGLLEGAGLAEVLALGKRRELSVPLAFSLTLARLDEPAKDVLAVLALDGGETTGEAALAGGLGWEAGDGRLRQAVNGLVQRSLVERVEGRCSLHPLVRWYAKEQLPLAQDPATQARLADYYLAYAEAHKQPTRSDYDALEAEQTNLLAAMTVVYKGEQWEKVRRFARALTIDGMRGMLVVRGYWAELKARLGQGLMAAEQMDDTYDIAAFTHNLAMAAQNRGEYAEAKELYERSLQISEEVGNRPVIAQTLHELGRLAQAQGKYTEARELYERSLQIEAEMMNQQGMASTLHELGRLAQAQGKYTEAKELYRRSLQIKEEVGNWQGMASTLHELGRLAQAQGKYAEAKKLYRRSLQIKEEVGNLPGIALTLWGLGNLALDSGDYAEAQGMYQKSLPIFAEIGDKNNEAGVLHQLGRLAQAQGEYTEARGLYERSLQINEGVGNRPGIAYTVAQLANLVKDEGDAAEAERLYKEALATLQELGDVVMASILLFNLALLYEGQGRLGEAVPLLEEAVAIAERVGLPDVESDRKVLERVRGKLAS